MATKTTQEALVELESLMAQKEELIRKFDEHEVKTDAALQLRGIGLQLAESSRDCLRTAISIIKDHERRGRIRELDDQADQLVVVLDAETHDSQTGQDRLDIYRPDEVLRALDMSDCDAMEGWKSVWAWDGEQFVEAKLHGTWHDIDHPLHLKIEAAGRTYEGHGTDH